MRGVGVAGVGESCELATRGESGEATEGGVESSSSSSASHEKSSVSSAATIRGNEGMTREDQLPLKKIIGRKKKEKHKTTD